MKIPPGVRIGLLVLSSLLLLATGWMVNRHKLWERWETFHRLPVFGKSWANEVDKMKHLYPRDSVDLLFLGDSHMEQCEWQEFFPDRRVANRGIGGESTAGLLSRCEALPPARLIFLQIGINDLLSGISPEEAFRNYCQLIPQLEKTGARVVPSLVFYTRYSPDVNPSVSRLNALLMDFWKKENRTYLSVNEEISEGEVLKQAFTPDGIHLNSAGYRVWLKQINAFLKREEAGSR